jgi:hypothetical protein
VLSRYYPFYASSYIIRLTDFYKDAGENDEAKERRPLLAARLVLLRPDILYGMRISCDFAVFISLGLLLLGVRFLLQHCRR